MSKWKAIKEFFLGGEPEEAEVAAAQKLSWPYEDPRAQPQPAKKPYAPLGHKAEGDVYSFEELRPSASAEGQLWAWMVQNFRVVQGPPRAFHELHEGKQRRYVVLGFGQELKPGSDYQQVKQELANRMMSELERIRNDIQASLPADVTLRDMHRHRPALYLRRKPEVVINDVLADPGMDPSDPQAKWVKLAKVTVRLDIPGATYGAEVPEGSLLPRNSLDRPNELQGGFGAAPGVEGIEVTERPGEPARSDYVSEWLSNRDALVKRIEGLRREHHTMGAKPQPGVVDYAPAGQAITLAMAALDEGLPNGQRGRCEQALLLLEMGTQGLKDWMKAVGYDVKTDT